MDNIAKHVMTGMIDRDPLDDLLNKMNMEYCPKLLGENDWPDGVKKEFATNLHKFMCILTEAGHKRVGRTQLYIPNEDLHDVEAAAKEKDQIQRLESIVIYWTRQIKELVTN
jgi:dynein heavy chain